MSSNRLSYDHCSYKTELSQSVGPLGYLLNPINYENCNACRHELGLVGGPGVSHIKGNMVDLENDLRGQTRQASKCPSKKYAPSAGGVLHIAGNHCNKPRNVDLTKLHLPSCQMIHYPKPVHSPPPAIPNVCPTPVVKTTRPCGVN